MHTIYIRGAILKLGWYIHWELPEPRLKWVRDNSQWRNLVPSYLASTSFVDAQIGRILAALDETGLTENTIVVVWGDHGWHLGEKSITGKNTLWDDGTRVPPIFAGSRLTACLPTAKAATVPHFIGCQVLYNMP